MKANINETPLRKQHLPKRYTRPNGITIDGYDLLTNFHSEDGWREIVIPSYNNTTHRLGVLVLINDEVTHELIEIIPPTADEIARQEIDTEIQEYLT